MDYAKLVKTYGQLEGKEGERRYSPPTCTGTRKVRMIGRPDMDLVSTSYVERQNLNMRMSMRRFTRLTNAFSRKVENHAAAVSLHFMAYNFLTPHGTLTRANGGRKTTPAMAAGVTDRVWAVEEHALADGPREIGYRRNDPRPASRGALDKTSLTSYYVEMTRVYSTYEAKARFSEVLRQVREGKTVTVSYRGTPVAEIRPIPAGPVTIERRLKDLEDRGVIVHAREGRAPLKGVARRPGALERFLADRNA